MRAWARRLGMGSPNTVARPPLGAMRPVSILMVVVLPAPLGPRNPKMLPASTANETPLTASTRFMKKPCRKVFCSCSATTRGGATMARSIADRRGTRKPTEPGARGGTPRALARPAR